MLSAYAWIFITGIIVFFLAIVLLLFFTRSPIELPLSLNGDAEFDECIIDSEQDIEQLSEDERRGYETARAWQAKNLPNSIPAVITQSQFLSIQEKGVSAFEFEWGADLDCIVGNRTEIEFHNPKVCCVQTNMPLPQNQDVYYWEAKMYEKPHTTAVAVGVSTKPYPSWRMPGWNKYSIGYFSDNGCKYFSSPFNGKPYGDPFSQGDVIGVGYRRRTGTLFFTKNGRKLEDAYHGLRWNWFPTIGANGPCQVHVNLGQAGFVFIEANVKKWGLAPLQGSLEPPPPYGFERGTILLPTETASIREEDEDGRRNSHVLISMDGASSTADRTPPPYSHSPSSSSSSQSDSS